MTLGEFKRQTAHMSDDIEIVVRWKHDECCHIGGVSSVSSESGCTDTDALMIDADSGEGCPL